MTEKLIINTSLYPQYEVEINGAVFKVRAVNRAVFELLESLTKKAIDGDPSALAQLYDQVALVIDAPTDLIDSLDYRVIRDVMRFVNMKMIRAEEQGEEKNEPKPGEEQ